MNRKPNEFLGKSVWAANSRYYIDGKSINVPISTFQKADVDALAKKLEEHKSYNSYDSFNSVIRTFTLANQNRLDYLKDEASSFIHHAVEVKTT